MVTLPRIAPMLATPGTLPAPAVEERWATETKQDGQRCIVYAQGDGSIGLRSRSGEDITPAYPELHALGAALRGTPAVLDGEIVVLDDDGRSDFERLQTRMGLRRWPAKAARLARRLPAHLVLFDVMFLNGSSLVRLPYTGRREALQSLQLTGPHWSVPAALPGHTAQALEATRAAGLEGIVCKRLDSVYEPGARSRSWIKIRNIRVVDAIVGGWVPVKGRTAALPGALLMGQRTDHGLRYVGSVGTGWNERQRAELARLLQVAAIDRCPFTAVPKVAGAQWVLPRLVAEIGYSTQTRAGLLRQPSWHRLRPDLAPEDTT
jgi:bifunctional non-homologous end joining protein LigD